MKRKGISPVISTVILLSVTIALAVGVSMWMSGVTNQYAGVAENVEVYVSDQTRVGGGGWTVSFFIKNICPKPITIDRCYLNTYLLEDNYTGFVSDKAGVSFNGVLVLDSGNSTIINLYISETYKTLTAGTSCEFGFHTTGNLLMTQSFKLI